VDAMVLRLERVYHEALGEAAATVIRS
jgi:hypothetical protein